MQRGFAYDPDFDYVGTANAASYDQRQLGRSQGDPCSPHRFLQCKPVRS